MRAGSVPFCMKALGLGLLASWTLLGPSARATSARQSLVLFTTSEAAVLRITESDWPPSRRMRSARQGPRVVIERPTVSTTADGELIQTDTPTSLIVRFEPGQDPVDMRSLEVTARKGWFTKSLTDRLRPYLKGTTITVDELTIPEGSFVIEIEIADTKGVVTTASYRLTVGVP